jgi:hypothetical protein
MTIRVPRRASSIPVALALLWTLVVVLPLDAAHETATREGAAEATIAIVPAAADSDSSDGQSTNDGHPTDIDQIIDTVLSWVAAIQVWGR